MEELKRELKQKFNWVVWNLDSVLERYGALGTVKFLINLLWEQYYSNNSMLSRQEIISWIGELENLLSKYSRKEV
jgi:hypothetical protein